MTWLQFIADMTRSLAWPAAVLGAVFLLRKEILRLLRGLRSLKHGDTHLQFGAELEEAKIQAAEIPTPPQSEAATGDVEEASAEATVGTDRNVRFGGGAADSAPDELKLTISDLYDSVGMVIRAWSSLERDLQALTTDAGLPPRDRLPGRALSAVMREELLDHDTLSLLHRLRDLRNAAAHGRLDPTSYDAAEFFALAHKASILVNAARGKLLASSAQDR